jgi:hypothetical protein
MLLKFSQKWAKEEYEHKIKELIRFVKGNRRCADLLVKVFIYTKAKWRTSPRGSYRSLYLHGFYSNETQYINRGIRSVVTVKLPIDFSEESFVYIFAHEFKHYLDMHNLSSKEKYKWWEKRANKFANKKVEEFRSRSQINA